MRVKKQFNKYAKEYENYSVVQQNGVKELIQRLPKRVNSILDLGCGSGRVYKELVKQNVNFNSLLGVDFSNNMLKLHPKDSRVTLMEGDFNSKEFFNSLDSFEYTVSASSLQWAKDIDFTLNQISKKSKRGAFFIFSSGTFRTIHKLAGIESPIHPKKSILKGFKSSFKANTIEELNYKLHFNNTLDMLRYIKKSGVSGGGAGLSVKDIKKILDEYPYSYLEFETLLLIGTSKSKG